jgi:Sulfite exporter TauE/SafE.
MHQAVGTSAVLGFFIALPGAISYILLGTNIEGLPPYSLGYVNILIVALVISTSIFTANIGAKLSSRISKEILKKIFAIFLLFTCTSLVIEHFII